MSVSQRPHEIINGEYLPPTGLYGAADLAELSGFKRNEIIAERRAVLDYVEEAGELDGFYPAGNQQISIHSFVFDAVRRGSVRPEYVMKVLAPLGVPMEKNNVPPEIELLEELKGHPNIPILSSYGW